MSDCFETINKAATNYARDSDTSVYAPLVQGLQKNDPVMAIALLKFFNQMINRAEEEITQAKFIAKLEGLGIFNLFKKWGEKGDEEINSQIEVFFISSNAITPTQAYQLEVHKNRCKELELHSKILEKKLEQYKENDAIQRVMMNDFEVYKQKADQTKELATFFSPFTPINQFGVDELNGLPKVRDNVLDMSRAIKGGQAERIKELEQELQNMKDLKKKTEKLTIDLTNEKAKYHSEKEAR